MKSLSVIVAVLLMVSVSAQAGDKIAMRHAPDKPMPQQKARVPEAKITILKTRPGTTDYRVPPLAKPLLKPLELPPHKVKTLKARDPSGCEYYASIGYACVERSAPQAQLLPPGTGSGILPLDIKKGAPAP